MSLQPSDPAAEAFERLRSEVALLRRAVEGLAADREGEPVDYSPTLAELSDAVAAVDADVTALGERPLLALAPDQLGSLIQIAAAKILARPVAELERARAMAMQAVSALQAARQGDLARSRAWRRTAAVAAGGAFAGAILWGMVLGPVARMFPAAWGAPERLAAATLALPMAASGERLLARGDADGAEALQILRRLPQAERNALQRCIAEAREKQKSKICTLKLQ